MVYPLKLINKSKDNLKKRWLCLWSRMNRAKDEDISVLLICQNLSDGDHKSNANLPDIGLGLKFTGKKRPQETSYILIKHSNIDLFHFPFQEYSYSEKNTSWIALNCMHLSSLWSIGDKLENLLFSCKTFVRKFKTRDYLHVTKYYERDLTVLLSNFSPHTFFVIYQFKSVEMQRYFVQHFVSVEKSNFSH